MTKAIIRLTVLALILTTQIDRAYAQQQESSFTDHVLDRKNMSRYKAYIVNHIRSEFHQKELGISAAQVEELNRLREQGNREEEALFAQRPVLPKEELDALSQEEFMAIAEENKRIEKAIDAHYELAFQKTHAILTETQRKRMAQVVFQTHLSDQNTLNMYLNRSLEQFVKIEERDRENLNVAVNEANRDFLRELAELNVKYHQKVISECKEKMGTEATKKIDETVGEPWMRYPVLGTSVLEKEGK